MFKLESYIAPLLMGYIDKYVKLKQEDFQLSLWGGDAVLNKLDLRLDAIEHAIRLPITFKSGFIHELRIHVPWTRLGYEPVVITINTIECVLKLRDSGYESVDSGSNKSPSPSSSSAKPKQARQDEDLPPGYLQSLMNRIVNNVNIVCNNVILKFVEDDIVLSVNIKCVECFSVGRDWTRAFVELALPELVLRKVVDFQDFTICLDKRNASGKIETYQDPFLYRSSMTCHIYMVYDGLHAKFPAITKFNLLCEKLELSLTDTQVPMFFRLLELCLAIYYGTLDLPGPISPGEELQISNQPDIPREYVQDAAEDPSEENSQGWTSWAWSYVPQIMPTAEEMAAEGDLEDSGATRKKPGPPVLILGSYIKQLSVVFKLTEIVRESQYHGPQKVSFKPCMTWEAAGISLDIIMRGLDFFNVRLGVSFTHIFCQGESLSGVQDIENSDKNSIFLVTGETVEESGPQFYLHNSLFDPDGPESHGERPTIIFNVDAHNQKFCEKYALERFSSLWMDYLYTMEDKGEEEKAGGSVSSGSEKQDEDSDIRENSNIRLIFGPLDLTMHSSMKERLHKFFYCVNDHEYEPYSKQRKEVIGELSPPSESLVKQLEEFIPTRAYSMTFIRPTIHICAADLGEYSISKKKVVSHRKAKKHKSKNAETASAAPTQYSLPVVVFSIDRFEYENTVAMYPRRLVRAVSMLGAPTDSLVHHCHSHLHLKAFAMQGGIQMMSATGEPVHTLRVFLQPISGALYRKTLLLPMYWKNSLQPRVEYMCEVPQLTLSCSAPQLFLLCHLVRTWTIAHPDPTRLMGMSLTDQVFFKGRRHPVLEVSFASVDVHYCHTEAAIAMSGSLGAIQVILYTTGTHGDQSTPLVSGPVDTSGVYNHGLFLKVWDLVDVPIQQDLLIFTLQLPHNPTVPQAPGLLLLKCKGMTTNLDPQLYDWLSYLPTWRVPPGGHTGKSYRPSSWMNSELQDDSSVNPGHSESHASQSDSQVTFPTESGHTPSLTLTTPTPSLAKSNPQGAASVHSHDSPLKPETHKCTNWGDKLASFYPLVKMLQVEIDIQSWCGFFPVAHVASDDTSPNILQHMRSLQNANKLPGSLVVCCPQVSVLSAGHKQTASCVLDIPVRSLEHSTAGDKLPWSIELQNASVYTIHQTGNVLEHNQSNSFYHVVKPTSVSATVAISTKYTLHPADKISSLGLCVHADMQTIEVACSKPQLQLGYQLSSKTIGTLRYLKEAAHIFEQLHHQHQNEAADTIASKLVTPASNRSNIPPTSTSSQLEQDVLMMGTIEETSEASTRETSPSAMLEEEDESVKLSLWLQWTLPKMIGKIYTLHAKAVQCTKLELEDLTTAFDLQNIYSKVRCKMGAISIIHSSRENTQKCSKQVLVTSDDYYATNVSILTNKLWSPQPHPHNMGDAEDHKPKDTMGFMSCTFTRALRKNVKRKKNAKCMENTVDKDLAPGLMWLHEICVNMQPLDIVIDFQVLASAMDILQVDTGPKPEKGQRTYPHKTGSEKVKPAAPFVLSSQMIPLVYLNTKTIRVFVPSDNTNRPNKNLAQPSSMATLTSDLDMSPPSSEVTSSNVQLRKPPDVFVLQLNSLSISPHADNPLPRNVAHRELYRQAVHSGSLGEAGAELENRQYQLDLAGLALATGSWVDLCQQRRQKTSDLRKDLSAQNPALEWNTIGKTESENDDINLIPMATRFDLRVVIAPAITAFVTSSTERTVVCGYSLEVNATSDMEFYLSTHQVALVHRIFTRNISALSKTNAESSHSAHYQSHDLDHNVSFHDSGVESETSIATQQDNDSAAERNGTVQLKQAFVPFDLLLTARKISLMMYSEESLSPGDEVASEKTDFKSRKRSEPTLGDDVIYQGPSLSMNLDPHISMPHLTTPSELTKDHTGRLLSKVYPINLSNTGYSDKVEKHAMCHFWPFLYAYFSQPHTLVSCLHGSQKMELSCFDLVLKGAKTGHKVSVEQRPLPEPSDYAVHWLQTRPGKSDPKTGIPPSLYSLQLTNFIGDSAEGSVTLARPILLNASLSKVQQALDFLNLLKDSLCSSPVSEPRPQKPRPTQLLSKPAYLHTLAALNTMELKTVQIVVAVETNSHVAIATGKSLIPGMQMSLSSLQGCASFRGKQSGFVNDVGCAASVQDLMICTSLGEEKYRLIGPVSSSLTMNCQWGMSHSGPAHSPKVSIICETGLINVAVGQGHVICISEMQKAILTTMAKYSQDENVGPEKDVEKRNPASKFVKKSGSSLESTCHTNDDLRAGAMQYIEEEGDDDLPQPQEILFATDLLRGEGSMTWCYPEPRTVLALTANPIPFSMTASENVKVPCFLQYWDSFAQKFMIYAEFYISENDSHHVELPEVSMASHDKVKVAKLWRVQTQKPIGVDAGWLKRMETEEGVVPLVPPMSLAASLCINSCCVPALVPTNQVEFSCPRFQIHVINHPQHLGQRCPHSLTPFQLVDDAALEQDLAVVTLENLNCSVSVQQGVLKKVEFQGGSNVQCDVLEYHYLTMLPLLEPVEVNAMVTLETHCKPCKLSASLWSDAVYLRISQSVTHTLNLAVLSWKNIGDGSLETIVPNYYIVCNNTGSTVYLRQVNTDERVMLPCHQALPYSWRSHKGVAQLCVCLGDMEGVWTDGIDVHDEGCWVKVVEKNGIRATVVLRVKLLSPTQRQVLISGLLMVQNRLSQDIEVKMLTVPTSESSLTLHAQSSLASFLCEQDAARALKVKLAGVKKPWSHEISVSTEKAQDSKLVKLPMQDKFGFIHVWCHIFTQEHQGAKQTLVLFSPLFVVRTQLPNGMLMNIETPQLRSTHQVALQGKGVQQQLHMMGGDMTHNITFQLSSMMQPSSPPVMLSSGLINQMQKETPASSDLYNLCQQCEKEHRLVWPFNQIEKLAPTPMKVPKQDARQHQGIVVPHKQFLGELEPPSPQPAVVAQSTQPDIDLQVNLSQLWSGCNTLLIDIVPHWLLVNECSCTVMFRRCADGQVWSVASGKVLSPPVVKDNTIQFGVAPSGGKFYMSPEMTLSDEDDESRYLPQLAGVLYLHGHLPITITTPNEEAPEKLFYLSLHSTIHENLRVVTVRERICMTNQLSHSLHIKCLSAPLKPQKMSMMEVTGQSFTPVHCHKSASDSCQLLQWSWNNTPLSRANHVQYISFKLSEIKGNETSLPKNSSDPHISQSDCKKTEVSTDPTTCDVSQWSQPLRLKIVNGGSRQSIAIPNPLTNECEACVLTIIQKQEIIYLSISDDRHPAIALHNNCPEGFFYGQSLIGSTMFDVQIQEEAELVHELPFLPPHSDTFYTFPSTNSSFPAIAAPSKSNKPPQLHLAGVATDLFEDEEDVGMDILIKPLPVEKDGKIQWSSGIDITSRHDSFVCVPDSADIKVYLERVGHTVHMYFDPVSRAEVSAKEIRSRIHGQEMVVTQAVSQKTKIQSSEGTYAKLEKVRRSQHTIKNSPTGERTASMQKRLDKKKQFHEAHLNLEIVVICDQLTLVLIVEKPVKEKACACEALRVTVDNVVGVFSPKKRVPILSNQQPHDVQDLIFSAANIQIDNQVYGEGGYDFPVLLQQTDKGLKAVEDIELTQDFLNLSMQDKMAQISSRSLLTVTCVLHKDLETGQSSLMSINTAVNPLKLFIEDTYIYYILKEVDSLIPVVIGQTSQFPKNSNSAISHVPRSIQALSRELSCPIQIDFLQIESIEILLSIHASLKLFISSDKTPLNMGICERQQIFTTSSALIHNLAMHYATRALFKAGWVVGSLELFGNPSGLLTSVSSGVVDLFRMPYESLRLGPGAFLTAVTSGMTSFLRHISTGTLTSVTNFASSVSRNMDRLSLDAAHIARQDASRRQHPTGLSEGLFNGLTGLGISLLGAVAGIADQPLQSLTQNPQVSSASTRTQAATSLVSSLGKGLVGIVTKPVGGAAELVSQAGMGLLLGVGLVNLPIRRHLPVDEPLSVYSASCAKFRMKLLQTLAHPQVLITMETSLLTNQNTELHPVTLVLTPEVLVVVNITEDEQQQAFAVTEVKVVGSQTDACLLYVTLGEGQQEVGCSIDKAPSSNDRVAEFINRTTEATHTSQQSSEPEERVGTSCVVQQVLSRYDFHVDMATRDNFLAVFNIARDKALGVGFTVI